MLRGLDLIEALSGQFSLRKKVKEATCLIMVASILGAVVLRADARGVEGKCYQVWLAEKPLWVASALARQESPPLIVVDPIQNKLLAYSQTGDAETLPSAKVRDEIGFFPTAVDLTDGGDLLLELADSTVIQLGHDFGVAKVVLSPQARSAIGMRVGSLYQWKLAGNYIVAYGALLDSKDNLVQGFFRISIGATPQIPEILTLVDKSDFYLVGNSYIATIGSTAYYVVMGKSPAIFKVSPGHSPEQLSSFPATFKVRPEFETEVTGPKDVAQHFAELEKFTVASGLYSQGEFLYLLTRRPRLEGTEWSLYKIDPLQDRIISEVKLPTSAHHLSVAASKSKWFFIQKGPVKEMQRQDINSMIVVDSLEMFSGRLADTCPVIAASRSERVQFLSQNYYFVIAAIVIGLVAVLSIGRLIWASGGARR